jgi:hypothetical protein
VSDLFEGTPLESLRSLEAIELLRISQGNHTIRRTIGFKPMSNLATMPKSRVLFKLMHTIQALKLQLDT